MGGGWVGMGGSLWVGGWVGVAMVWCRMGVGVRGSEMYKREVGEISN